MGSLARSLAPSVPPLPPFRASSRPVVRRFVRSLLDRDIGLVGVRLLPAGARWRRLHRVLYSLRVGYIASRSGCTLHGRSSPRGEMAAGTFHPCTHGYQVAGLDMSLYL